MSKPNDFQTLRAIGAFLSAIGWVIIVLSILGAIIVFSIGKDAVIIGIVVGIFGTVQGLLLVALGQLIQCVVAVSQNTAQIALNTALPKRARARFRKPVSADSSPAGEESDAFEENENEEQDMSVSTRCAKCGTVWEGELKGEACGVCGAAL